MRADIKDQVDELLERSLSDEVGLAVLRLACTYGCEMGKPFDGCASEFGSDVIGYFLRGTCNKRRALVCLARASRAQKDNPAVSPFLNAVKDALLRA